MGLGSYVLLLLLVIITPSLCSRRLVCSCILVNSSFSLRAFIADGVPFQNFAHRKLLPTPHVPRQAIQLSRRPIAETKFRPLSPSVVSTSSVTLWSVYFPSQLFGSWKQSEKWSCLWRFSSPSVYCKGAIHTRSPVNHISRLTISSFTGLLLLQPAGLSLSHTLSLPIWRVQWSG